MTPEKYNRVKEIFLAACDKAFEEQVEYVERSSAGDEEIRREVESLLREQRRETQVMPSEPESPLGSMSSLLMRASVEIGAPPQDLDESQVDPGDEKSAPREKPPKTASGRHASGTPPAKPSEFLDDSAVSSGSGSGYIDSGRFMAGTMVAGRYRIIELLGRGGMGEVYRADDITLNQSVALKFLPTLFGSDEKWLERFRNEVRLARQVTHPNVCRVFDIGEFEGEQFISMEYVDGDDLASLLRRIGRVPHDKALQIARQLCAGLAAAHDRGVLHRDLKPANVMIDGRGYVRITDFGLAAPADQLKDAVRAGTPAYMSPEQLAGRGVTVRSDIYSLGLLLYEMFTGKRPFKANSLREYQKLHTSEEPTPPSEILEDIDPIVERVILKCLEKDPKNRPASAMAVSAGLPGGNPLREILAAGETPSPEVVAAAGASQGSLKPRIASTYLLIGLVCLILAVALSPSAFLIQLALREKSPAVLTDRAATLLHEKLGYPKARDAASGFASDLPYYRHIEETRGGSDRWRDLIKPRPGMVYFWYRESPDFMVPLSPASAVQENDPPAIQPGEIRISLDAAGQLLGLEARPLAAAALSRTREPRTAATASTAASGSVAEISEPTAGFPPWTASLLEAAGLAEGDLTPVPSGQTPPVFADARAAWNAMIGGERMHIEAAALKGRPVYFAMQGRWKDELFSSGRAERMSMANVDVYVRSIMGGCLLLAAAFLAWRNYRSGRGDRAGAMRMGVAFFGFGFIAWLLLAHHVPNLLQEISLFHGAAGAILYPVCVIWIFYLALEPYVRRIWPETVISWNRLLGGKWFDPLVGRHILIGSAAGALAMVLQCLDMLAPRWLGFPAPLASPHGLIGFTSLSPLFSGAIGSLYVALIMLLLLVLLRMALRRKYAVYLFFVLLYVCTTARWGALADYVSYPVQAFIGAMFLILLVRHGLVALVFCVLMQRLLTEFPVTFDFSLWYAGTAAVGLCAAILLLALSFYTAVGGRSQLTIRPREA